MVFDTEAAFEEAVIEKLKAYGWDDAGGVLKYPTEQQLLDNWAAILFENNKHRAVSYTHLTLPTKRIV